MRIVPLLLPILLVSFAGCFGSDEPEQPPAPEPEPPAPEPEPEPVIAFDDTLSSAAPGGVGSMSFNVPAGFDTIEVIEQDMVMDGNIRLVLIEPSGAQHVILDGVYLADTDDGIFAGTGPGCPCGGSWNAAPGTWTWQWTVTGSMDAGFLATLE